MSTVIHTMETGLKVQKMVKVYLIMPMEIAMRVFGLMVNEMVTVPIFGKLVKSLLVVGKMIIWKAKVCLYMQEKKLKLIWCKVKL